MTNAPDHFAALMERVAQGDEQAATELFDQYLKAIIRVIRYRLNRSPQLRTLFDSMDFLQEVWQDVFADPEKLRDFATFEAFLKYLAETARNKVQKTQRKYATQKRDRRRLRHLSDPGAAATAAATADPQPNPAEWAASFDAWQSWIQSLPQRQREIVQKLRDGYTHQEIAEELDCSVRSIERMVAEIRVTPPPMPLPCL